MKTDKKFLRQCIFCKELKTKEDLIRITKDYKTGEIKINNNSSVQGRSVYICKNSKCLENTIKKKLPEKKFNLQLNEKLKENLYILLNN